MFVFLANRAVPPTNNGSEQALRPCVAFQGIVIAISRDRDHWGTTERRRSRLTVFNPGSLVFLPCEQRTEMPTERLSMRQIREVLRLHYSVGMSQRTVARSLGLAQGTVSKYHSGLGCKVMEIEFAIGAQIAGALNPSMAVGLASEVSGSVERLPRKRA